VRQQIKRLAAAFAGGAVLLLAVGYLVLLRYDYNGLKPDIVEAVKRSTGRALEIRGDLRLELGLSPSFVAEDLRMANVPWGSRPDMATVSKFELRLSLTRLLLGEVAITKLVLIEPDLLIETNGAGESNLGFAGAGQSGGEEGRGSVRGLALERFELRDGLLTLRDGRTGKSRTLTIQALTATGSWSERMEVALQGGYGTSVVTAAGSVGPLDAFLQRGTPLHLELELGMEGAVLSARGSIAEPGRLPALGKAGIDIALEAGSTGLSGLAKALGVALPSTLPGGDVALRGVLSDPARQTLRIADLELRGAGSRVNGTLEIGMAGPRPSLKGKLDSPRIDLSAVFPRREGSSGGKGGRRGDKVFPDGPLPLQGLSVLDAELDISVEEFLLPWVALTRFRSDVRLAEGLLTLPVKATVGGGSMDCTLRVDSRRPHAEAWLVLSLKNGRLGPMLTQMGRQETLDGVLSLEIDAAGRGRSLAELMSTLDGSTLLVVGEGRIENKQLELLNKRLSMNLFRLLDPHKGDGRATRVDCLVNRFVVSGGVARLTALVADTPTMRIKGKGEIDLRTETIDIKFDPAPKQGLGLQGIGTISLSMSELARPLTLDGTLAKPSLGVDLGRTAWTIGKAAGGVALFGPVGVLGALAGGNLGGQEDPCLAALEEFEQERQGIREQRKGVQGRIRGIFE
jgi:AsmA family protein